jgi:hypothetical protein
VRWRQLLLRLLLLLLLLLCIPLFVLLPWLLLGLPSPLVLPKLPIVLLLLLLLLAGLVLLRLGIWLLAFAGLGLLRLGRRLLLLAGWLRLLRLHLCNRWHHAWSCKQCSVIKGCPMLRFMHLQTALTVIMLTWHPEHRQLAILAQRVAPIFQLCDAVALINVPHEGGVCIKGKVVPAERQNANNQCHSVYGLPALPNTASFFQSVLFRAGLARPRTCPAPGRAC